MTRTLLLGVLLTVPTAAWAATLDEAAEHLLKGRYAEAIEAYEELGDDAGVEAVLGHSRALQETGEWEAAAKLVEDAPDDLAGDARLLARRAELHLLRGELVEAEKLAKQAIASEADEPLARWVQAEVLTETGRIAEADVAYRWFVRYYNRVQPKDAGSLLRVADGAAQYARWRSVSSIFNFIVNDLCPDALKDAPNEWRAWRISGSLLAEKFNRAQAKPEFDSGLAVNPRAADLLVSIGEVEWQKLDAENAGKKVEEALAVNPRHVGAFRLKADLELANGNVAKAIEVLQKALEVNPRDQRTLGRLAAAYVLADGEPNRGEFEAMLAMFGEKADGSIDPTTRLEKLFVEVAKYNRRPGYLLADFAETLDGRRKFELAEYAYTRASEVLPQLSTPKVGLGLLHMRVGQVDKAKPILDAAFKSDPYHVRVSNMRKVVRTLDGYETIETDHFIVQFDGEKDRVLGEQMAEYLEEVVYPTYTKLYGFEPPQKTRFEIFNEHKGLSGHEWFSARMTGLPWIQTIGATTGMIVAFASPNSTPRPYNWAQVCRHEFVHVVTLQQTEFNIPHWFTEALAVTSEGYPRPSDWNDKLLDRVPNRDLRTLEDLTDGFVRPRDLDDWAFAYCQSKLYADYMREKYGDASIRKLLAAYEENKTTTAAVPEVFGVDLETFEQGYLDYLDALVETLKGASATAGRTTEEIEKAYEEKPDDPTNAAALARIRYKAGQRDEARELAEKAIDGDADNAEAAYVLARLEVRASNRTKARELLRAGLDEAAPHGDLLDLLAKLELTTGNEDEAERLFALGRKTYPFDARWLKGMAAVALKSGDVERQRETLTLVANTQSDDATVRLKLAQLAFDAGDFEEAEQWAKRGLHVKSQDAKLLVLRGRALAALDREDAARKHLGWALVVDPENADAKSALDELD